MPEVVRRYEYTDEEGRLLFVVERLRPKGFRQWRPGENGEHIFNLNVARKVLYRLPEVLAAVRGGKWVLIVEGEKDADAVRATGRTATTSPGGAGKWQSEYAEVLRGAKVAIIPDQDNVGIRHGLSVACDLDPVASEVRMYAPVKPHKDISAHLAAGLGVKDLVPFDRAAAQAALVPKDSRQRAGVVSVREFCARPGLNGSLQLLGPALNRTMRLSIGAATGDGKTTLGLQMIRAVVHQEPFLKDEWRGRGGRALIVDVEQGEETVKQRLRDLELDKDPNVDLLWEPDGLGLDRNPDDRKYVYNALRRGRYDVVLFDPLYQLHCGNENEERTAADVMKILDGWAREFQVAIIIPMHRRKVNQEAGRGVRNFTINDIGGHGAWIRNSEIVLGLQVKYRGLSYLHFFKDRPGRLPGIGERWPLAFDASTSTFSLTTEREHGQRSTKKLLKEVGVQTVGELAAHIDVTYDTIRKHLRAMGAFCEDRSVPLAEQRWSLEEFPNHQTSIFDEEESHGRTTAAGGRAN